MNISRTFDCRAWEVFDPRNGIPLQAFYSEANAARYAELTGLDYALMGDGWDSLRPAS